MQMIDSKSLFYTVHYVLKQIELIDNIENWNGTKETIQQITLDSQTFTLMAVLKRLDNDAIDGVSTSLSIDQQSLINAAHELVCEEPRPTGHEFFKKDVQQFSDLKERKFVLSLTLSADEQPLV
jgi:hypothetical protein